MEIQFRLNRFGNFDFRGRWARTVTVRCRCPPVFLPVSATAVPAGGTLNRFGCYLGDRGRPDASETVRDRRGKCPGGTRGRTRGLGASRELVCGRKAALRHASVLAVLNERCLGDFSSSRTGLARPPVRKPGSVFAKFERRCFSRRDPFSSETEHEAVDSTVTNQNSRSLPLPRVVSSMRT